MEKFMIGDVVFVSKETHIHYGKIFTVTELGDGIVYDNKTWYEIGDVTLESRPTPRVPDAGDSAQ